MFIRSVKKNAELNTATSITIVPSPVLEFTSQFTKQIAVAQPSEPMICFTSEFLLRYV